MLRPRLRRVLVACAVALATVATVAWWELFQHGPPTQTYGFDLAEVRRLADALPGDKPVDVRFEKVAAFRMPSTAILAGSGLAADVMPVFAWQLVWADRTALVDTGMDEAITRAGGGEAFDAIAFEHIQRGIDAADFIVLTHEHFDHIGGLAGAKEQAKVLQRTRLSAEQRAHPEKMAPAQFAPGVLEAVQPLAYEGLTPVAPGVVLIKSPGHTPGSQMVYVRRSDGRELLFVGDIAWHKDNVDQVTPRARFVSTIVLEEDRDSVLAQLAALHALTTQAPDVYQVPGHDGPVVDALVKTGLVRPGFKHVALRQVFE